MSSWSGIVHLEVNNTTQLDRSFLALSHPVRRTIVERLAAGPTTVGEATAGLRVSKPAVTKHLRVLEDAGVISRRIEGRTHRLSLRGRALADAESWLETYRRQWERKFDAVERQLAKGADSGST
jgi:DNA-binding transcriptional ArsR family regulator